MQNCDLGEILKALRQDDDGVRVPPLPILKQSPKPHHGDGQRHGKVQVIAP